MPIQILPPTASQVEEVAVSLYNDDEALLELRGTTKASFIKSLLESSLVAITQNDKPLLLIQIKEDGFAAIVMRKDLTKRENLVLLKAGKRWLDENYNHMDLFTAFPYTEDILHTKMLNLWGFEVDDNNKFDKGGVTFVTAIRFKKN